MGVIRGFVARRRALGHASECSILTDRINPDSAGRGSPGLIHWSRLSFIGNQPGVWQVCRLVADGKDTY
jgi:hypothetical protein